MENFKITFLQNTAYVCLKARTRKGVNDHQPGLFSFERQISFATTLFWVAGIDFYYHVSVLKKLFFYI